MNPNPDLRIIQDVIGGKQWLRMTYDGAGKLIKMEVLGEKLTARPLAPQEGVVRLPPLRVTSHQYVRLIGRAKHCRELELVIPGKSGISS